MYIAPDGQTGFRPGVELRISNEALALPYQNEWSYELH